MEPNKINEPFQICFQSFLKTLLFMFLCYLKQKQSRGDLRKQLSNHLFEKRRKNTREKYKRK